ncbi:MULTISPECIES: DUF3267 domain-containing protein [unclassified Burkholderia]|uniref:DUF3267 domain-containing protein n=1 Tax=unclassified Burkholderia TaxID=2613784 RepID=UPI00142316F6|nr:MULTISPECIES: DUF3267 domain-containing protein [unclassified Burkholderia]NIE81824.1 DUF3267 domain-containing protein [Burkholderia sp. Tr-860]NIF64825.1 DUF3267 domain-containing protein [Burkholderia sp. Cy-647]NIF93915.1 DUF3267 domain-containing protein [Burkholderia sp. Ax-1720]
MDRIPVCRRRMLRYPKTTVLTASSFFLLASFIPFRVHVTHYVKSIPHPIYFDLVIQSGTEHPIEFWVGFFVTSLAVYVIHEFTHVVALPNFGIGHVIIKWSSVTSKVVLSRKRYAVVALAPLVTGFFISGAVGFFLPVTLRGFAWLYFVINSVGSSLDVMSVVYVVREIPKSFKIKETSRGFIARDTGKYLEMTNPRTS